MPQPPDRLRLGFAGTPPFAATILDVLIQRHDVAIVYSQPSRRTGRGRRAAPSAVERRARSLGIEVRTPTTLRAEAAAVSTARLDALIVAAYGLLLPRSVLDEPRYGCINVHASLLPRWRGAAPIERAIMAGDTLTGISIMQMDEGLDTGPILQRAECPIARDETGDSLRERLAKLGAVTLIQCLDAVDSRVATPQSSTGITYAAKLNRGDSLIDWAAPASDIALKIRALNSRQSAFCFISGLRLRLLFADAIPQDRQAPPGTVLSVDRTGLIVACGTGAVRITRVALSKGSGRTMDIAALINGHGDLLRAGQALDASN